MKKVSLTLSILFCVIVALTATAEDPIVIASKNFPESFILAEMMSQILESEGYTVERKFNLAGTKVCFDALVAGEVDIYPEYTGTVLRVILGTEEELPLERINAELEPQNVRFLQPFGFNNSYAITVTSEIASRRNLKIVSDLVNQNDLKVFFSHEFIERMDGWPGLRETYGFDWQPVGIEHALAYRAMADGEVDATDGYTTDGEIDHFDLKILEDDKGFFPKYFGIPLVRNGLDPQVLKILDRLANTLDDRTMTALNAQAMLGEDIGVVAQQHLATLEVKTDYVEQSVIAETLWATLRHLQLTGISLGAAVLIGLLISILVFRHESVSRPVVYFVGLLQTIPSIALLALMIPLFGTGIVPAIIALFLYSLLPIIRNSVTALSSVDPVLLRVATGMGLNRIETLRFVYIPLAMPAILAGIRTSAIICIGTATLAAYIGAGGLGDFIVQGLALDDTGLIIQGAASASILAILVELMFEGVEKLTVPKHLTVLNQTT